MLACHLQYTFLLRAGSTTIAMLPALAQEGCALLHSSHSAHPFTSTVLSQDTLYLGIGQNSILEKAGYTQIDLYV